MPTWDALEARRDSMVGTWELLVRREAPALFQLAHVAIVVPIAELFARAVSALRDSSPAVVPEAVKAHAISRTSAGLGAEVVAWEYACMRQVLRDEVVPLVPMAAIDRVVDVWANAALVASLHQIEQARERMVAILAHDLRTPLTCIGMAAEMLALARPRDSRTDGLSAQILAASERMQRMVHDMLELARRQLTGDLPVAPRPDDLGAICRSVVDEIALAYPERHIVLDQAGDLRGSFDRDRASQAISNLVRNALEHGIGTIRVRAVEESDRRALVLDVTNRRAAHASGPLPALAHRGEGRLGFGLYIVHKIAAAHGATCSHDATGGEATFTIRWPRP